MRILEIIFRIIFYIVAFIVVAGVTFVLCYFGYSIIDVSNNPTLEPIPGYTTETGAEVDPCLENDPERIVIQELIESKQLCEEALGIYQQIEKVREQLEENVR